MAQGVYLTSADLIAHFSAEFFLLCKYYSKNKSELNSPLLAELKNRIFLEKRGVYPDSCIFIFCTNLKLMLILNYKVE